MNWGIKVLQTTDKMNPVVEVLRRFIMENVGDVFEMIQNAEELVQTIKTWCKRPQDFNVCIADEIVDTLDDYISLLKKIPIKM